MKFEPRGLVSTVALRRASWLALAWLAMTAGLARDHRYLIYWPDRRVMAPSDAGLHDVTNSQLVTADGERLVVWRAKAPTGRPTILYFHGDGDHLAYRAERIRQYQTAGLGVYLMSYRGYSGSTGTPTERANVADALLAYDALRAEGLNASDIVIYGESLGTGVATQVAVARPALGLVLEAPFLSLVTTWKQFVPFLPISTIFDDRYDSERVISQVAMPLLIIHGDSDGLVWPWQSRELFALAPQPKTYALIPAGRHANLYQRGALQPLRQFIDDLKRRP
jgi:uncharacterized protein